MSLALRLFRHHRGAAIATGLIALIGMALVSTMTTLLATGLADSTAEEDRSFLTQFPARPSAAAPGRSAGRA
ncbi:hypothetical protein [Amycolatopsis methanolica]|uniref:hypothetical protein n=1 Tax=Amycolatopsis methanolica TaxID=1814 RepID=UPI001ADF1A2C|nr:hypothetical protein [Amycolatopsis methanolica]